MSLRTLFPSPAYPDARILVVDSLKVNIKLLTHVLEHGGYTNVASLQETDRLREAVEGFQPHLLIFNLVTPHREGLAGLAVLKREVPEELPVLVISNSAESDLKHHSLGQGASDYLVRPFEPLELLARVSNLIRLQRLYQRLSGDNALLGDEARVATEVAERMQIEMLARLARVVDHHDGLLGEHTWRVARLAGNIALALGQLPRCVDDLRRAARLHDIGKVAVPDRILASKKPLTDGEWVIVRTHPEVGARILSGGTSKLLVLAEQIALTHHERWDGTGYPQGLAGEDIPLEGRIVAVADAFDAMTSDRPYRKAMSVTAAVAQLEAGAGTQFDPAVVQAITGILTASPQTGAAGFSAGITGNPAGSARMEYSDS